MEEGKRREIEAREMPLYIRNRDANKQVRSPVRCLRIIPACSVPSYEDPGEIRVSRVLHSSLEAA